MGVVLIANLWAGTIARHPQVVALQDFTGLGNVADVDGETSLVVDIAEAVSTCVTEIKRNYSTVVAC